MKLYISKGCRIYCLNWDKKAIIVIVSICEFYAWRAIFLIMALYFNKYIKSLNRFFSEGK